MKKPLIYFILAALFLLPHLYTNKDSGKIIIVKKEIFDNKLHYCTDLPSSIQLIDKISSSSQINGLDTVKFVNTASQFIKRRFYHGTANYTFSENWIANLLGKYVWSHFYAIVMPNDVLKRSKGLCSQQTIVFMELLKSKNIRSRKVGLRSKDGSGHFLCEVYYKNSWHIYDVNAEPDWSKTTISNQSMEYYLNHKDELFNVYEEKIPKPVMESFLYHIEYGEPNEFPAKKMRAFHIATKLITILLPLFFFILALASLYKNKVRNKLNA